MIQRKKNLPVGIEDFREIRTDNFYYVDKTGLIIDLLNGWSKVTLFTRPRRFGKSLNMSMLDAFFKPDGDKSIFEGLKISREKELCDAYMGRYPTISLSLKSINALSFETARDLTARTVRDEAKKYEDILPVSPALSENDRKDYSELLDVDMSDAVLYKSLQTLSALLKKHFGQKVIVLIDEYDVPLAKASDQGYYDQMVSLIRNLLENILKSNNSLKFAVLTGCMRISKESIFTGLNNLRVLGVADERAGEYFGFTDHEVKELLAYYDLSDRFEEVKNWYDGYRFGNTNVFCPWDVINYTDHVRFSTNPFPENYWINSSGNDAVRRFIRQSMDVSVKNEIEALINGDAVEKTIRQELTYRDMYASNENIWSVLFMTGYLTQKKRLSDSRFRLVIPNREVRNIFAEQILDMFREDVGKDGETHVGICSAFQNKDISAIEKNLGIYLRKTISIRDTAVRRTLRENFYQGILLAILSVKSEWSTTSNQESGDGYCDIIVRFNDYERAMVIEIKYADNGNIDAVCRKALRQIDDRNYAQKLYDEGFVYILKYGIAFHIKKCRVMLSEEKR